MWSDQAIRAVKTISKTQMKNIERFKQALRSCVYAWDGKHVGMCGADPGDCHHEDDGSSEHHQTV